MGIRRDYEILDHAQRATFYSEQTDPRFRPLGARGGSDARPARISLFDADGNEVDVPQKSTTTLERGWTIRIETSGGGGYGVAGRRRTGTGR
jgi:N-methylhydantoinase B